VTKNIRKGGFQFSIGRVVVWEKGTGATDFQREGERGDLFQENRGD
jgi:hypothetical protein